jgi:transcription termination factor Rho
LGRAYNAVIPSSGKVLTGGVDAMLFKGQKDFLVQLETLKKVAL